MAEESKPIGISPDWIDGETKVLEAPHDHGAELRLWLRLLTCSTLVETEIRRRLREKFDCTLPRFDLMAQLERAEDGMVLGELSRRMMVSPGNMTALVERLVESGHISRTALPADRRVLMREREQPQCQLIAIAVHAGDIAAPHQSIEHAVDLVRRPVQRLGDFRLRHALVGRGEQLENVQPLVQGRCAIAIVWVVQHGAPPHGPRARP